MRVGFIGAGRMAEALISRLPRGVIISDIRKDRLNFLKKRYGARIAKDNLEAFALCGIVVLAVKPQQVAEVLGELGAQNSKHRTQKLVISIAAGIPLDYLQRKLPGFPVIRAMPNNPALVGAGITALARGKKVNRRQLERAKLIFAKVGEVVEVPEKWMDAVTGLSGSGPAFVYQAIEALIAGGVSAGLPRAVAEKLALQTVAGAAAVVRKTGKSPKELTAMVASPGGTTIEGLKVLKKAGFSTALQKAVVAAAKKSKVLSKRWTL